MGTAKKYRGMRALECVMLANNTAQISSTWESFNTIKYKTTDGTPYTSMYFHRSYYGSLGLFMSSGISAIASPDELADYTGEEYQNDGVGTVSILSNTLNKYDDKVSRTVVVKITNSTESSISIGSVKILHGVNCTNTSNVSNILCLGYYFGNAFTLAPNESVEKTLRFDFGIM